MNAQDTLMYREAHDSARIVAQQLAANARLITQLVARIRALDPQLVVTCARGSSDHAATFAKYLIETQLGIPTLSHAPSVSSVYRANLLARQRSLFIAISQSGKSPDLLESARVAKASGAMVLALVNQTESPLALLADQVLPIGAGLEQSVAATKSFIASLSAIVALVAEWSDDAGLQNALIALPDALDQAWEQNWSAAWPVPANAHSLFVVSRGMGLAIAQEVALKFKETCGIHAEAISAAEVQHGPMALVRDGFPIMMLTPIDATQQGFHALAAKFVERRANVAMVAASSGEVPAGAATLPLAQAGHPILYALLLVQAAYRFLATQSVARGFNPDQPAFLNKATLTT
jgi:glutamine---fructose-6-phosphate transaminase (isomerizing)